MTQPANPLSILQVNATDRIGGAAEIAWMLHQRYNQAGHRAWLTVGQQVAQKSGVIQLNPAGQLGRWASFWLKAGDTLSPLLGKIRGAGQLRRLVQLLGQPARLRDVVRGHEDFNFAGIWNIFNRLPGRPDIVHCHNLHGDYFDLRALPWLSRQAPVVLHLHDAWLLSGHCAHSFLCRRWQTGCGHCPDLSIPPLVWRDATAYNWQRKRAIFADSRVYVTTPSQWLMDKVTQSMLAPAIIEARVIPNGVDLSVFQPADKRAARAALGLPSDAHILLFAASGIRDNIWKDYHTLRSAVLQVAKQSTGGNLLFVALGDSGPSEKIGPAELRFVPYQNDVQTVARYYQAADLYLHAARVDTFPNTVLEALACGTPVIVTAVGGIPEQVKGLAMEQTVVDLNKYGPDEATGVQVAPQNPEQMIRAVTLLLDDTPLRHQLGRNAARDVRQRFDSQLQADRYLAWYQELLTATE